MRRRKLSSYLKSIASRGKKKKRSIDDQAALQQSTLSPSLSDNLKVIEQMFLHCSDVIFRKFEIHSVPKRAAAIVWMDGIVDTMMVNEDILTPLMDADANDIESSNILFSIRTSLLHTANAQQQSSYTDIVNGVLTGNCVILIDGECAALTVSVKGGEMRAISEPATEAVVRGPRQGFTENFRTNTSMIRRIVKTPALKMEACKIGRLTKTDVVISYIQGVADEKVVEEVRQRIRRIDIDSILESAYIEELIEDQPYSPFPQIAHSERPDKVAGELLEGKVAIVVDGTPFVLIVPAVFVQFLQSSEDYYERYPLASAIRVIRYFFFLLALILPSAYIAATTYHQEMLPTPLLISIAGAREGVPFPAFVEALLMEVTFEVLREAGVRLPRPVGQAVSIVGALVIGESAVNAGIVSSAMVIVVAVTAIASFAIPAFNIAITFRLLRFPMMVLASILGFYGIMLGILAILIHLCTLRSFGVPYFSPIAPFHSDEMKDVVFRAPWWKMKKRPGMISRNNRTRQQTPKPEPPSSS
ncbi:spore germination protein [Paenibacillus sp. strain BS8-2]